MTDTIHHLALFAGIAIPVLLLLRVFQIGRRPAGYPPGPPTLPIIGNIHQIPHHDPHKQFQKWAQEYGPVYSLILGTATMIVLSSDTAVKDLMDKRSGIYSSRPDMYIGQTLCSGGLRFLMMHNGPQWRMSRKMIHTLLNVTAARSYVPYQDLENKQMLHEVLEQPDQFLDHIRRYSNSLTTSIVFGWRTTHHNDARLTQLFKGFNEFARLNQTGVAHIIDYYPILRWIPSFLIPTHRKAQQMHAEEKALYVSAWLEAKNSIATGTARPCFCVDMARQQQIDGFSDAHAGYISGSLLEAGSDTTSNTLYGFLQAMLLFPLVQQRAQAELDRVVGPHRLPTMDDEPHLQYIRGCVKESLRWMPTAIIGSIPHAASADDEYLGYRIPRGAAVMNNVYAIHMDPARYPDPRAFDPDRFRDDLCSAYDSAVGPDVARRDHFTFGAGRRICQGMHVAERSLFLGISRLLWGFEVRPVRDPDSGEPVLPDPERYTQGFVCMPEPYEADIRVRGPEREEVIRREWEKARGLLDGESGQWKSIPEGMKLPKV